MKEEKGIFVSRAWLKHLSLGGRTHTVLSLPDLDGSGAGPEEKSWG